MYKLQSLTNDTKQKHNFILPNGIEFSMSIYFSPMQYAWFIEELTYLEFTLKGFKICNSPNILFQYTNQLPFGLGCFPSTSLNPMQREPQLQEDFSSGACELYVLTPAEQIEFGDFLRGET